MKLVKVKFAGMEVEMSEKELRRMATKLQILALATDCEQKVTVFRAAAAYLMEMSEDAT